MQSRYPILLISLVVFGVFLSQCTKTTTTTVYDLPQAISSKECVAILPFDNLTEYPNAGQIVADLMGTAFMRSRKFRVMERSEIERISQLSQLNLPRKMPARFARALGEVLEVDAILIGAVTEYAYLDPTTGNPGVSIDANLIDIETGKSLWISSHTRTSSDHVQYKKDPVNRIAALTVDKMTSSLFSKVKKREIPLDKICGNSLAILPPAGPAQPEVTPGQNDGVLAGRTIKSNGTALGSVILSFPGRDISRIMTDPETGSFKVNNIPPGSIRVVADKPGFVTETFDINVVAGKMVVKDLKLTASLKLARKNAGVISGKVLDIKGKPVPATVFVRSKDKLIDVNAKTKKNGSFSMKLPPGAYQVRVIAKGYITQNKKIKMEKKSKVILNVNLHSERKF